MPHRFKCPTCSKWHEGFPDVAYDRPYYVTEVPDAEFASRVFLTSDLCVLDDTHFFVRSVLPFRIRGAEDDFYWGVWSTLSEQNFLRYQAAYDEDMSGWDAMFGYLSNELPGYPDTLNLKLSVQTQRQGDRPLLTLEPTDHPLAVDQRDGMLLNAYSKS
jgi:hypothetical protein